MDDYGETPQRVIDRVLARCDVNSEGCHLSRHKTNGKGYVQFVFSQKGRRTFRGAHQIVWVYFNGPIPDGMIVDHACHRDGDCPGGPTCPHRRCVNIDHLRLLTPKDNTLYGVGPTAVNARKTHCIHGHLLDEANTYIYRTPQNVVVHRECRACRLEKQRTYRRRKKAARV